MWKNDNKVYKTKITKKKRLNHTDAQFKVFMHKDNIHQDRELSSPVDGVEHI